MTTITKNSEKLNILIIGTLPPPIGGVSVHIKRLLNYLLKRNHNACVLDFHASIPKEEGMVSLPTKLTDKMMVLMTLIRSLHKNTIVHFHVSAFGRFKWVSPVLLHIFKRQYLVVTIHSGSFIQQTDTFLLRSYTTWLLKHFSYIILVSEEQAEFLITLGIQPSSIEVIPAFIPEELDSNFRPDLLNKLPKDKRIVVTSGYLTPLYDYDALIDCINRLAKEDFHFVFAFYNQFEPEYSRHIYERLTNLKNVSIARNLSPEGFLHILKYGDIYVRTTKSDGDAVAIREAHAYGLDVFATDCVKRPTFCHIFPTSNSTHLYELLYQKYENTSNLKYEKKIDPDVVSNANKIVNVYYKVVSE